MAQKRFGEFVHLFKLAYQYSKTELNGDAVSRLNNLYCAMTAIAWTGFCVKRWYIRGKVCIKRSFAIIRDQRQYKQLPINIHDYCIDINVSIMEFWEVYIIINKWKCGDKHAFIEQIFFNSQTAIGHTMHPSRLFTAHFVITVCNDT